MFWSKRRAEKKAQQRAHTQAELRDALAELLDLVAGGPGVEDASPLILRHGERLVYHLAGGGLFEPRRGAGHWSGGSAGFSIPVADGIRFRVGKTRGHYVQGAEQATVIDHGDVTITTGRVVFQGGKYTREWQFDKLIGVMNFSDAHWTAIQVSNREKTSGVAYDDVPPVLFRLRLAVAIAMSEGQSQEAADELRRQLAAATEDGDDHQAETGPEAAAGGNGERRLSEATVEPPHGSTDPSPLSDKPVGPVDDDRPTDASAPPASDRSPRSGPSDPDRPAPPPPPAWAADPSGDHQLRYWDGGAWTDYVADNGQQSRDPLPPSEPTQGRGG
jgi:hypothetical protein